MDNLLDSRPAPSSSEPSPPIEIGYEAPAIEAVITLAEIERDVHYAGTVPISGIIG